MVFPYCLLLLGVMNICLSGSISGVAGVWVSGRTGTLFHASLIEAVFVFLSFSPMISPYSG